MSLYNTTTFIQFHILFLPLPPHVPPSYYFIYLWWLPNLHRPPAKHQQHLSPPKPRLKQRTSPARRNPQQQHQLMAKRKRERRSERKPTLHTFTRVCSFHFTWQLFVDILVSVLKQVHPDTGISNKAMAILNSFVNDIFERIATEASSKFLSLSWFGFVKSDRFFFSHLRTCGILQEVDDLLTRNSNLSTTYPAWRARQTCYFRRNEISNEYVLSYCDWYQVKC